MLNPEFTKNCWLEITPHRLYVTPVVILLVAALACFSVGDAVAQGEILDRGFIIAAFLFACVGGAYHSTLSMINEFVDHTWDQQRMSPMSPWTLTWGKIFGGASFMWYGAVLVLLLLLLVPVFFPPLYTWGQRIELTLMVLGLGVLAQAGGLMMVIGSASSPDRLSRYRRNYGMGVALFVILVGGYVFALLAETEGLPLSQAWWRRPWPLPEFWLGVIAIFAVWAALGAYRVMREQMQFRNGRLPWLGFNLFLMFFIAGFFVEPGSPIAWQRVLWVAFGVALVLAYALLIAQPLPQAHSRRLVAAARSRDWATLWQNLPLWSVSLFLVALLGVLDPLIPRPRGGTSIPENLLLEVFLFALRDSGVFVFFLIGRNPGRAIVTGFFYLIVLYSLIPMLVLQTGWNAVLGFFWPLSDGHAMIYPVLIEVALLAVLIVRRWRGYLGKPLV